MKWFMNGFMMLVRVMCLLLRHSVEYEAESKLQHHQKGLPPCIVRLFGELELTFDRVVWHQLFLFGAVDGLIQGYDRRGRRQFLAWVDMGEIFRFIQYDEEGSDLVHYQVTLVPYSWEPLCAEQSKAHEIEKMLQLDTSLPPNCVSRTFEVHRTLYREQSRMVEMRECRSRSSLSSDRVECTTERCLYRCSEDRSLVLERRKWWEGDKNKKPRQEHEEWYDGSLTVYKRIERDVNALGDAEERTYLRGDDRPSLNYIQRYADHGSSERESSRRNLRRRPAATHTQDTTPVLYIMPQTLATTSSP